MVSGILLLAATLRVFGSAGAEASQETTVVDAVAFFEIAPPEQRWKVRTKLRAEDGHRADVGEAFVQVRVTPYLDLAAGRVIEKWGTGYAWTPTAFVGPARRPDDPNDRRFANRGVDMLRADVFVRDTNVSLYALRDGRFAARVYRLIAGTDVSLVARSDDRVGLSLSRVFGQGVELHGEVTNTEAVAGAQVTFANTNVVAEVFRGEQTWAFVRVQRSFLELIAARNLGDGSMLVRATLSHRIRSRVDVYVIGSEFVHRDRTFDAGVRVFF